MNKKKKQNIFNFKYWRKLEALQNTVFADPDIMKSDLKRQALKKGYLIKNIKIEKIIRVSGEVARANVSLGEREKLQDEIDRMPKTNIFNIKN